MLGRLEAKTRSLEGDFDAIVDEYILAIDQQLEAANAKRAELLAAVTALEEDIAFLSGKKVAAEALYALMSNPASVPDEVALVMRQNAERQKNSGAAGAAPLTLAG